jgi:hypothetical protein
MFEISSGHCCREMIGIFRVAVIRPAKRQVPISKTTAGIEISR